MVFIPTGMNYTATMKGSTVKHVRCEQCQCEYVYLMEREATGGGSSILFLDNDGAQDRASQRAHDRLEASLKHESDLAACPECGYFQKHMIRRKKWKHFFIMFLIWIISGIGVLMIFAVTERRGVPVWLKPAAFILLATGPALAVWIFMRNFNSNAETRRGKPGPSIMRRDQFVAMMEEAQKAEAEKSGGEVEGHIQ